MQPDIYQYIQEEQHIEWVQGNVYCTGHIQEVRKKAVLIVYERIYYPADFNTNNRKFSVWCPISMITMNRGALTIKDWFLDNLQGKRFFNKPRIKDLSKNKF